MNAVLPPQVPPSRSLPTETPSGESLAGSLDRLVSASARESLQIITEAAILTSGFTIAAIALLPRSSQLPLPLFGSDEVVETDDSTMSEVVEPQAALRVAHEAAALLEIVAVAGSDRARMELSGLRIPVTPLLSELGAAEDWGLFKFVPAERIDLRAGEGHWIPDLEPLQTSDAWKPLDLLVAPLYDAEGQLRGALSIDVPSNGRRPEAPQRRLLEALARQARETVINVIERERLAEQVRLAEAARRIVRQAAEHHTLQHVINTARPALLGGFQALGMWLQTYDDQGLSGAAVYSADGKNIEFPESVHAIAYNTAHALWEAQQTLVLSTRRHTRMLTPSESREIATFLTELDLDAILFVPVGVGGRCVGNLVLTRGPGAPTWNELESAAALDIAHDLGIAIESVRARAREHALTRELHVLDTHVSDLVANLATTPALSDSSPPDTVSGAPTTQTDPEADPDPRIVLRTTSELLEQTGRRRDAQARILADHIAHQQTPPPSSVEVYLNLDREHRDARLTWQIAFDVWQESTGTHPAS